MSTNLHCRHHESYCLKEVPDRKQLCEHLGIEYSSISPETAGPSGLHQINNVFAMYPQSKLLQNLDLSLVCGLSRLPHDLAGYLLNNVKQTDASQMDGKIIQSSRSLDIQLTFGFGQELLRMVRVGMFSTGNTTTEKCQQSNSDLSPFYQKYYNLNFFEYLNLANYLQNQTYPMCFQTTFVRRFLKKS